MTKAHTDTALWNAYTALKDTKTDLVRSAEKDVWHKLWASTQIGAWIESMSERPEFCRILANALPDDNLELLEELRIFASQNSNKQYGNFLAALVTERLARCNDKNDKHKISLAYRQSFLSNKQYGIGPNEYWNYDGYVCATVLTVTGEKLKPKDSSLFSVITNHRHQLAIWLSPDEPKDCCAERLQIETGIEDDFIAFSFEIDCASLSFPYGRKRVRFHRKTTSKEVHFDFYTNTKILDHLVMVHVLQEAKLVKSLMLQIRTTSGTTNKNS